MTRYYNGWTRFWLQGQTRGSELSLHRVRESVRSAFGVVGAPKDFIVVGGRSTERKMILESGITLSLIQMMIFWIRYLKKKCTSLIQVTLAGVSAVLDLRPWRCVLFFSCKTLIFSRVRIQSPGFDSTISIEGLAFFSFWSKILLIIAELRIMSRFSSSSQAFCYKSGYPISTSGQQFFGITLAVWRDVFSRMLTSRCLHVLNILKIYLSA